MDIIRPNTPDTSNIANGEDMVEIPLIDLAWARSGDKGNRANIGIIARKAEYIPFIWKTLDEAAVKNHFKHFEATSVDRFFMPGMNAINFVLHDTLGGGGIASLRADPQGKAYGQILLHHMIPVPRELADILQKES
jgi:hypothetical protein